MRTVKGLSRNSKGQYEITIAGDDGVTAPFRLSEDLVVEYRLLAGRTIDDVVWRRFLADLDADGLYEAALRLIARAPKTASEIRDFLKTKTDDPAHADRVFAKLCAKGFVDDRAYALSYFDYHFGVRRDGPAKILFDLDRKGLFRDYAVEAVAGATAELVDRNLAWLFDRKLAALRAQPKEKAVRSMQGYLYRRGYDPGVVTAYCGTRRADFPAGEEEDQKAAADLAKAKKRLAGKELAGYALRTKLVQALMTKGYRYETIKRVMEASQTDES